MDMKTASSGTDSMILNRTVYVHVILIDDIEYSIIVINHGNHNIQVYDTIINTNKLLLNLLIIHDITNIYWHHRLMTIRLFQKIVRARKVKRIFIY